jgi:hypothetical protein
METCWGSESLTPHISSLACRWRKSHDSSVGIALRYGLYDRGSRVRFPAGTGKFSLHHRFQNGSGDHPVSYPMGTRGSFPGVKAAGAWSWPLTSIYCQGHGMNGALPPLSQYAFMAWCSVKKMAQGRLYPFTFACRWRWVVSFTPLPLCPRGKNRGTPCIGGWVGPRAGLDELAKKEKWILCLATVMIGSTGLK